MSTPSRIVRTYRRRLWFARLLAVLLLASILTLRSVSCKSGANPTPSCDSQPATLVDDDYARYNGLTSNCVKVLDGDTIDIDLPDRKAAKPKAYTRIRLWGIDTPEIAHPQFNKPAMYFGCEAAEFARKLMAGKKVTLELIQGKTRDKFGRLLAYVYLPDGRLYNSQAIADGYAYAEIRFKHFRLDEYIHLESQARKKLLGLWKGITPEQLPHWYPRSKLEAFWSARDQGQNSQTPSPAVSPKKISRKQITREKINF